MAGRFAGRRIAALPFIAMAILALFWAAGVNADGDLFIRAMSEGHAALSHDDPATAKAAFKRALELRPDAATAADGLAQAELELRLRKIVELGDAARAFEAEERFVAAAERYSEVLEIDSTVAFAQAGRDRARSRAELDERLTFYLGHPHRLAESEVLGEARAALAAAREIDSPGPRHHRQTSELAALVASWAEPLTLELISDGETEVTIYRVGGLGFFTERAVSLRPGTYTVVGSRRGYRDVRYELVIAPGETPARLTVISDEKI